MDESLLTPTESEPRSSSVDARRDARRQLLWSGTLQTSQGPCQCIVVDLSRGGAKLQLAKPVKIGQLVTLVVAGIGTYRGTVIWCENGSLGVKFAEERATPLT
jgi:hypothetical protein